MKPASTFVEKLSSLQLDDCFNPYRDKCHKYDNENAPELRRERLNALLTACADADEVDIWIGRDLGHRGGRRTGIALVDELTVTEYCRRFKIEEIRSPTYGIPLKEQTATAIAAAMNFTCRKILTWNVFPLHPYSGSPFSNRAHTPRERTIGVEFLENLIAIMPVRVVVPIGLDAASAVECFRVPTHRVRHPSYGGKPDFLRGMREIYGNHETPPRQLPLL